MVGRKEQSSRRYAIACVRLPPTYHLLPTPFHLLPQLKSAMPAPPAPAPRRIIVAITGASGAIYAVRLVQLLVAANVETHLCVSPLGQRLLRDELGMEGVDLPALAGVEGGEAPPHLIYHHHKDVGADARQRVVPPRRDDRLPLLEQHPQRHRPRLGGETSSTGPPTSRSRSGGGSSWSTASRPCRWWTSATWPPRPRRGPSSPRRTPAFTCCPKVSRTWPTSWWGAAWIWLGVEHDLNIRWATQVRGARPGRAER